MKLVLSSFIMMGLEAGLYLWMYHLGVPVSYILVLACTSFLGQGIQQLSRQLRTMTTLLKMINTEQMLQTKISCKLLGLDEKEVVNELKTEIDAAAEKFLQRKSYGGN